MTTDPSAADPSGSEPPSSDIEQALDEILSGVHALLKTAPKTTASLPPHGPGSPESLGEQDAIHAAQPRDASTRVLMALLAACSDHSAAGAAQRWIQHELLAQTQALGSAGGDRFSTVRVSPLIHARLGALVAQGATLTECNARHLFWDWPQANEESLIRVFGRLAAAVCLDQNQGNPTLRIPRIPERLPVRMQPAIKLLPEGYAVQQQRVALIDQDNTPALPSTLFWFSDGGFVPDHVCALTVHDGRWCPVLRPSAE